MESKEDQNNKDILSSTFLGEKNNNSIYKYVEMLIFDKYFPYLI